MIIDADALNILSFHKEWLKKIPAGTVLTPHPKEFDRLFGNCENDFERINKAIALTEEFPFIITLKGHHTCIASNGKAVFNTTGNAGLAKGGSGDVLCGMMVSFMAQHYSPVHAAAIAVYLHGLAADLSLENQSMESLLATDVMNAIGKAFNFLT
jgi:NAD(P)H-hydrate epimerase